MRQSLPDFFRDKRHERVEHPQGVIQDVDEDQNPGASFRVGVGTKGRFDQLDVPIAELVPEEVVDLARPVVETEFIEGL